MNFLKNTITEFKRKLTYNISYAAIATVKKRGNRCITSSALRIDYEK